MSEFEFLQPIDAHFLEELKSNLNNKHLGNQIDFYQDLEPQEVDFNHYQIAILGVYEFRSSPSHSKDFSYNSIRKSLYCLYPGSWSINMIDLGDIMPGNTPNDTGYLLQKIATFLLKNKVLLMVMGGGKDLIYYQYKSFADVKYMVNFLSVSHEFDLGDADTELGKFNYLSHMVVKQPYNLFNYVNLGYQTYYVHQDEIDLIDRLYFEAYRLGEVTQSLPKVEPLFRDADFVSFDLTSLKAASISDPNHFMVNGFSANELCVLARYAGISDKTSSFGLYELHKFQQTPAFVSLIAQMFWYLIEGVALRFNEEHPQFNQNFTKFTVPIDEDNLVFLQSNLSGRWWMELPLENSNNKLKENSFLSCSEDDYLTACKLELPERWLKAKAKNEF
ncbi:MAG: formimidoylglutamase [Flavobacteriaceae bacterium]|nr:formimidoylglutamase [Flavobacteriaceae bacterium]